MSSKHAIGFQCFYLSIRQILEQKYHPEDLDIFQLLMWDYQFTYNYFSIQNEILQLLEKFKNVESVNEKIEGKGLSLERWKEEQEITCYEEELLQGKPVFIYNNVLGKYGVILEYDSTKYLVKYKENEDVLSYQYGQVEQAYKVKVDEKTADFYYEPILTVTAGRYQIIDVAEKVFGLLSEMKIFTEEEMLNGKIEVPFLLKCDTYNLPYSSDYHKKKFISRYIVVWETKGKSVQITDVVEKYEGEVCIDTFFQDSNIEVNGFLFHWRKEKFFIEKKGRKTARKLLKERILENNMEYKCTVFYDSLRRYLQNQFEQKEELATILDSIYIQTAETEKIRENFVKQIVLLDGLDKEGIFPLFKQICELQNSWRAAIVRAEILGSESSRKKLDSILQEMKQKELQIIHKIKKTVCCTWEE